MGTQIGAAASDDASATAADGGPAPRGAATSNNTTQLSSSTMKPKTHGRRTVFQAAREERGTQLRELLRRVGMYNSDDTRMMYYRCREIVRDL